MQLKYISIILPLLLLSFGGHGQNTPLLTEIGPSGNVFNMAPPPEVAVFPGVNTEITYVPEIPISDAGSISSSTSTVPSKQIVFMDGFLHAFQSITRNVSNVSGVPKHLVQIFDNRIQRDAYSFLPFSSNTGVFVPDAFQQQLSYYNSLYPNEGFTSFSKSTNTSTSSERSGTSFTPGKSQVGQNRGTKSKAINNVSNEVRIWDIDANGLPVSNSYYTANELTGSETTLPTSPSTITTNPPQTRTYTDRDGKQILKMVADGTSGSVNTWQYTYYVYDTKGNLIYTIPPNAVQYFQESNPSYSQWSIAVPKLCFQNIYDSKNRLVSTHKPGEQGATLAVYDRKDRIVMRQTPKEAIDKEWEIIFYDQQGRVKATSVYNDNVQYRSRDTWQQQVDAGGSATSQSDLFYYLSTDVGEAAYPHNGNPFSLTNVINNNTIMSYNWFDNYQPAGISLESYWTDCQNKLQFSEVFNSTGAETPIRSKRVEGMVTGSMVRVLRSESAIPANLGDWRVGINFYDDKGRLINSVSFTEDETAGLSPFNFDYSGTKYDFAGRVLIAKHVTWRHNIANGQNGYGHTELTKYEYDATNGNPIKISHKVDGGTWSTLNKIGYDELGRVSRNDLGGGGEIQDFSYGIRGQLTGINGIYAETGAKGGYSKTFGESLKYDYGFNQPRYDGKIAGIIWRGASTSDMYAYGYSYSQNEALKVAEFRHKSDVLDWEKATIDYTVSNLSYDKNGNITSMKQRGVNPSLTNPVDMDDLVYTYEPQSNRIMQVVDNGTPYYQAGDFHNGTNSGTDYAYDPNGNLTQDLNRAIQEFKYTRFNKPAKITKADGSTIEYSYDAAGNKLEEIIIDLSTATLKRTDYVGNSVYLNNSPANGPNDNLQYMLTSVGRTVFDANSASPIREEFFVKDHLGNVRSTINTYTYSTRNYLATYEVASANIEHLIFSGIDEVRDTKPGGNGDDVMAANLNGADPQRRVGSSLLVHVMSGDKVAMSVNTLYNSGYRADEDQPIPTDQALAAIVGTLTGGVGAIPGEWHNTKLVNDVFNINNFSVFNDIVNTATDPSKPKAFLNYVLFDENMKIVNSMTGAFQANGDNQWSVIGTQTAMEVPRNGYLAVYLSNNSSSRVNCFVCTDVFFDDLRFTVTKGSLQEETHYYPFGLPMKGLSSRTADEFKENRKKYQGNELIKDLDFQLMDFNARLYDPQIGRFLGIDPLASSGGQDMFSPYAAMGNMPESMIDPNGLQSWSTGGSGVNLMPNNNTGDNNTGATSASGGNGNPLSGSLDGGGPARGFNAGRSDFGVYTQNLIIKDAQNRETNRMLEGTGFHVNWAGNIVNDDGKTTAQTNRYPSMSAIGTDEEATGGFSIGVIAPAKPRPMFEFNWAARHIDDFDGFWGQLDYLFRGGDVEGAHYDMHGNLTGWAYATGTPPIISMGGSTAEGSRILKFFTTSSKSLKDSRTYTIFNSEGQLVKFGVTDAAFKRMEQSLAEAGKNSYPSFSAPMTKSEAHLAEKYLRSLHYNSPGSMPLLNMKIPYPVNFLNGAKINPGR